jgi:hypothetical protein
LAILLFSWELSNHPVVDFKFNNFIFSIKILKNSDSPFLHFPVLLNDKYLCGENRVVNPNLDVVAQLGMWWLSRGCGGSVG